MVWWSAAVACIVSGLTTLLLVPSVAKLALSLGALDHPGGRKQQQRSIPRLGGVAVVLGIGIGIGIGAGLAGVGGSWPFELPATHLLFFSVAALIIFILGVQEDLHGVSVFKRFLFQIIAAWIVVGLGWQIERIRLPFTGEVELGVLAPLISLAWIVGVTNAINLLDGLDGLAGGIVAIVSLSLMSFAVLQSNLGTVILTSAVAGACLGFLWHNWEPAIIYLGDSGSLTLGFLLASFSLQASLKTPAAVAILIPILALGLPVIDTVLVMGVRFLECSGDPFLHRFARMFKADRKHLHHLALALAPRRAQIVLALYGVVAVFCLSAIVVAVRGEMWLGIIFLMIQLAAVVFIRQAGLRAEAQKLALGMREEARRILVESSLAEERQKDLPEAREAAGPAERAGAPSTDASGSAALVRPGSSTASRPITRPQEPEPSIRVLGPTPPS